MHRPRFMVLLIAFCCATTSTLSFERPEYKGEYKSPYKVVLTIPMSELMAPNNSPPRNNPKEESATPFDDWYSQRTLRKFGAWGPQSRRYPEIDGFASRSPEWKRQRVLAVAAEMIGLPYQHHHIPDWDPPAHWPWKEVAYGRNSKGMDCSDFTSWIYNYGLGIKPNTGIGQQAEATGVEGHGENGASIRIQKIYDDKGFDSLCSKLRTGDLLYIKHKDDDKVSHVIMWVGNHGESPDGAPLVIDCTGADHTDSNGNQIPIGVHLRPFKRDTWYYKSFSHANRIIEAD